MCDVSTRLVYPFVRVYACVGVCLLCVFVPASCARASLTLHSPVELLFPDSRRTIRLAGLERQRRKCDHCFSSTFLLNSLQASVAADLPLFPLPLFFLKKKFARFPRWRSGRYGFNHLQTRHAVSFSAKVLTCQRCASRAREAEGEGAELWPRDHLPHVRTFGEEDEPERL